MVDDRLRFRLHDRAARAAARLLPAMFGTILCVLAGPSLGAPSTYPLSCIHIGISSDILHADCRRDNGELNHTSIALPGIENIGGGLHFSGLGHPSTFQNSCAHIGVAGATLAADCRRNDGRFRRSTIGIPDIAAIDGVLTIASSGGAGRPPGPPVRQAVPVYDGGAYEDGYDYNGQSYEWYDEGWRGPGFYVTGFAFRQGLGYGGGEGWRGWHHGGPRRGHAVAPAPASPGPVGFRRGHTHRFEPVAHRGHGVRFVRAHRAGVFHARFGGHRGGGVPARNFGHRGGGARQHFALRRGGGFHPHPVHRFGGFRRGGFRPVIHRVFVRPRRHR